MTAFLPGSVRQEVRAEAGYAYGVIGADLHVIAGRGPVYLLTSHTIDQPALGGHGPPAQPSHLLNARSAVVGFTGRADEVGELTAWRDSGHPLAALWLHGPGGQGKTRLAGHLADRGVRAGWKVITAEHTAGQVDPRHPVSQDLRVGDAAGVLLVVDYADRWPLSDLTWLLSNSVLKQAVPVRVLLLARTTNTWPALRHALTQAEWPSCTSRRLGPLPATRDSRREMFTAARDSFARHYRLADPRAIPPPDGLDREEFGLVLAVHMAALVAVDRHTGAAVQPPLEDVTGLTAYLLDRERHHWQTRHDAGTSHVDPETMTRAVFTAALTGSLPYQDARAALDAVGCGPDSDRLLDDHTSCYPPADPRTVLEPLYPDRLAEDFLALCLPGHDVPGPWAKAWADGAPDRLLTATGTDAALSPHAARTITFLTAACERWPHLVETLEALENVLPDDPMETSGELAVAAAGLAERLTDHRLATATEPAVVARLYTTLGRWLDRAGQDDNAAAMFTEATRRYRDLAAADPDAFEPELARAAFGLAWSSMHGGMLRDVDCYRYTARAVVAPRDKARLDETCAIFDEAITTLRRAASRRHDLEGELAGALFMAAFFTPHLGRPEQAVEFAREVHDLGQKLARTQPEGWADAAPYTLTVLAASHAELAPAQALEFASEAVDLIRQLARENPAEHGGTVSAILATKATVLLRLGRTDEAHAALHEAVAAAQDDEDPWGDALAMTVGGLWVRIPADDTTSVRTASELLRRLAQDLPDGCGPALLNNFYVLTALLERFELWEEILAAYREMISLIRASAGALDGDVLGLLNTIGSMLAGLGRWEEALTVVGEAARELQAEGSSEHIEDCLTGAIYGIAMNLAGSETTGNLYQDIAQDEAVDALTEIAGHYRKPARENPGEYTRGLAVTVGLLSEAQWSRGRRQEAVEAGREAVRLRIAFVQHGSVEHDKHLAVALFRLADKLTMLGRHEEATAAANRAVGIRRRLVRDDPVKHRPGLAHALRLLAENLAFTRLDHAADSAREAVDIVADLAAEDPATFEPDLASALTTFASLAQRLSLTDAEAHHRTGAELPSAWIAIDQAVTLYRRLAADDPRFGSAHHEASRIRRTVLSDLSAHTGYPRMGPIAQGVFGDTTWLVLVDPTWWSPGVPPPTAQVGGWRLDALGLPGPFQPNPAYTPRHPGAPTDPTDFALHLAAAADGHVGDQVIAAVRGSVLEIARDDRGQPVISPAPDGRPCVLAVSAPRHKHRVAVGLWTPVVGSDLPGIVPDGVDILLNPGGPAQLRLFTPAVRATGPQP